MRYSFQGHFRSKMWSIAKEYLPEAKHEEFWRYIRLADEIRPPREIAAVEVAVGVVSHLPSQLDTLEAMLQAALHGAGICCEAAADNLVTRYLGGVFEKDLLKVPGLQKEWLTIGGSAAIVDTLRAESGLWRLNSEESHDSANMVVMDTGWTTRFGFTRELAWRSHWTAFKSRWEASGYIRAPHARRRKGRRSAICGVPGEAITWCQGELGTT